MPDNLKKFNSVSLYSSISTMILNGIHKYCVQYCKFGVVLNKKLVVLNKIVVLNKVVLNKIHWNLIITCIFGPTVKSVL